MLYAFWLGLISFISSISKREIDEYFLNQTRYWSTVRNAKLVIAGFGFDFRLFSAYK